MWWIVFTAVDLYVGLIALDAMLPSLPADKRSRAIVAKKVIVWLLVFHGIALLALLIKRWSIKG